MPDCKLMLSYTQLFESLAISWIDVALKRADAGDDVVHGDSH